MHQTAGIQCTFFNRLQKVHGLMCAYNNGLIPWACAASQLTYLLLSGADSRILDSRKYRIYNRHIWSSKEEHS